MARRPRALQPPSRRGPGGFTLIEVMIAVTVIGILAAVTYPSLLNQIRKARRSDAIELASRVQQAQERYRTTNVSYGSSLGAIGVASSTSTNGLYTATTAAGSGAAASTSYTITLTAVSGKSQASDSGCTTMTASLSAGTLSYSPATCWSR